MTRVLVLSVALLGATAVAQTYSNGPLVTHPGAFACFSAGPPPADASTYDGTAAPTGPAMGTIGYSATAAFRVADDFTVPVGQSWMINSIKAFGYQTLVTTSTASTFTAGNYRIWCGDPSAGGTLIHDYSAANQMTSTQWTNMIRTSRAVAQSANPCSSTANTSRKVMEVVMGGNSIVLGPGTYWLDYALAGSVASGPFVPPVSIIGQPNTGNGKQFTVGTGTWSDLSNGLLPWPQGVPFEISYTAMAGTAPTWQTNSAAASVDFNGVQANACTSAAITNLCVGETVTATLASNTGALGWELAYDVTPVVPLGGGGLASAFGQTVNINLASPALMFLLGLTLPPFPTPLGGASPVVIPFATPPITFSVQMLIIDPSNPDGIALSQAAELNGIAGTPPSFPIAGPTADEGYTTIELATLPGCTATSMPFYGTNVTKFHIASNGYVSFDAVHFNDASPSTAESQFRKIVGCWADLNPVEGGTISVSSPAAGQYSVDFMGVSRFGAAGANSASYSILLDTATGNISLLGLNGIQAGTIAQWLGISNGYLGTTGSTAQALTWAVASGSANPGVSTYQFAAAAFVPGVTNILFVPNLGGYAWTAN